MKKTAPANLRRQSPDRLNQALFWTPVGLLFIVPLAFSTSVRALYALPKFAVLLVGASSLLLLLARRQSLPAHGGVAVAPLFSSRLVRLVWLYFALVTLATLSGVASLASLFGSVSNFMGLLTQLCFLICFIGLIVGIGASEARLRCALWVIVAAGGLVALYACVQSFGLEPFVPASIYTFNSPVGRVARVCSSLGHSNYLGNFLLYVAPLAAALALAARGWSRYAAGLVAALALVAIVVCGARGAWVGAMAGGLAFAAIEMKASAAQLTANRRRVVQVVTVCFVTLLLAATLIALSPASRSIGERVQALRREGLSSSGRLLLWRDSLKMIPTYALVGCGPEGYRKAALAYKSKELAALAPQASNESPHNAYLETAIAYGLPAAAAYFTIIILTLKRMAQTRSRAPSPAWRMTMSGLIAAWVAVLVHDLFIFDQITTGLYFFAYIALAIAAGNCLHKPQERAAPAVAPAASTGRNATAPARAKDAPAPRPKLGGYALTVPAAIAVLFAVWYVTGLITADCACKHLFEPATANDLQALVRAGERATASPLPTHAYDLPFAYALELYARRLAAQITARGAAADVDQLTQTRADVLRQALAHAEKSLEYTNTPDASYVTLASIALAAGDVDRLNSASDEAVRRDPNNYQARWLRAEAYLARGDRDAALREAEAALEIYHVSPEAASALARARGQSATQAEVASILLEYRRRKATSERSAEELLEVARRLTEKGKLRRARIKLLTAASRSNGPCPDCHRQLAIVYEKMNRFNEAISEWQAYREAAPESAASEQVAAHIEALKPKLAANP